MRLGYDRIAHITHKIVNSLWGEELVDFADEEKVVAAVKDTISKYLKIEEEIDSFVRAKIASLSRKVPEGSNEYNVLYRKYYEQELDRRGW